MGTGGFLRLDPAFAYAKASKASFLMTFAMGGVPHAGSRDKTISKNKICKTEKWLSEEALQIAVKRREAKSKGKKERYTHLNAEFQRLARKDKKAFLMISAKK